LENSGLKFGHLNDVMLRNAQQVVLHRWTDAIHNREIGYVTWKEEWVMG
jgi:hypothetical protein